MVREVVNDAGVLVRLNLDGSPIIAALFGRESSRYRLLFEIRRDMVFLAENLADR
jgi:hypothetical protein